MNETEHSDSQDKTAWDLVVENEKLINLVMNQMSSGSGLQDRIKHEVIDCFPGDAEEALHRAALEYLDGSVQHRFATYASKALRNQWNATARRIVFERGEGSEDGKRRGLSGVSYEAEKKRLGYDPLDVEKRESGPLTGYAEMEAPSQTSHKSIGVKPYAVYEERLSKRDRYESDIQAMIRDTLHLKFRETPNLTDREIEAVGLYLWGEHLEQAKVMWKNDLFDMMIMRLLAEGQYPSWKELQGWMKPTRGGYPITTQQIQTTLKQAAKKLGSSELASLRARAIDGLLATELRCRLMAAQRRYKPPVVDSELKKALELEVDMESDAASEAV